MNHGSTQASTGPFARTCPRGPAALSVLWPKLLVTCLFLAAVPFIAASAVRAGVDLKVEGPWVEANQVDAETDQVQFVAMTPAIGDDETWLLVACTPADGAIDVSLVAAGSFPYPLGSSPRVELRLDTSPAVTSSVDAFENRLVRLRPPALRKLVSDIDRSSHLAVTIQEPEAPHHDYDFRLQPSDFALRNIRVHCLGETDS
jgi:hypothetical protein